MTTRSPRAKILVVDDNAANLDLLFEALTRADYKVVVAQDGESALLRAEKSQPDLILLDILMPGIDGYETLRRLKSNPVAGRIPVIIMTALAEPANEVRGFSGGAVDFITKPIRIDTVLARVQTHLTISRLQHELKQNNDELNAFAETVARDLQRPLAILAGYADMLNDPYLQETDRQETVQMIEATTHKMSTIVDELLLLSTVRQAEIVPEPVSMAEIVSRAIARLARLQDQLSGQIIVPESWPAASGHTPWIEEVWLNYLSNGLKYGGRPPRLRCGADRPTPETVRFWVQDNGPGIPPAQQEVLFTNFIQLQQIRMEGQGLGLAIVKRIVDRLGGQVGLESNPGQGSLFYFILPAA